MGLPCKACLYGFILFVTVAFSLTGGCICGRSPPGQPAVGNSTPLAEPPGFHNDYATITNLSDAGSLATPTPVPTPTSPPSAFTVHVNGGKDHQPGETLQLYGVNTYSDTVYLFISGTTAPIDGGRLEDARTPVVDGDPSAFTRVDVGENGSWEYLWKVPASPPALMFDLYNVIASTEPRNKPHLDEASAWDMVTVKIS